MNALNSALTAIAIWGATCVWDQTATIHALPPNGHCIESGQGPTSYLHQAEIGVGIALITPKRWRGPALTVWFGSMAAVHAHAALRGQGLITSGGCR